MTGSVPRSETRDPEPDHKGSITRVPTVQGEHFRLPRRPFWACVPFVIMFTIASGVTLIAGGGMSHAWYRSARGGWISMHTAWPVHVLVYLAALAALAGGVYGAFRLFRIARLLRGWVDVRVEDNHLTITEWAGWVRRQSAVDLGTVTHFILQPTFETSDERGMFSLFASHHGDPNPETAARKSLLTFYPGRVLIELSDLLGLRPQLIGLPKVPKPLPTERLEYVTIESAMAALRPPPKGSGYEIQPIQGGASIWIPARGLDDRRWFFAMLMLFAAVSTLAIITCLASFFTAIVTGTLTWEYAWWIIAPLVITAGLLVADANWCAATRTTTIDVTDDGIDVHQVRWRSMKSMSLTRDNIRRVELGVRESSDGPTNYSLNIGLFSKLPKHRARHLPCSVEDGRKSLHLLTEQNPGHLRWLAAVIMYQLFGEEDLGTDG